MHGAHNVPAEGPIIYCPNHQSDVDPVVVATTIPRRAWYMAKAELFRIPVLGWALLHYRTFPVRRGESDRNALRTAEQILKKGRPLVIFPEGKLSPDGNLLPMQPGAAMLAMRIGAPIVPIGIRNTNKIMAYSKLVPHVSKEQVIVNIGAPIYPSQFEHLPKSKRIRAFTEQLGEEISKLSGYEHRASNSGKTCDIMAH